MKAVSKERVVSGMRPTGKLHLGHYHGALKNWAHLQECYDCFFFVADWHSLTTHYQDTSAIRQYSNEMVLDWIAAGVDPTKGIIFRQSQVLEHAELHLLLSMIVPLSWLERVPTYKSQQELLANRDLSSYGFLGYPLLQSADVLIYRANWVPVGEDQVPHIELSREIARRFNHFFSPAISTKKEIIQSNSIGKEILIEPKPLLTKSSKVPGVDGQKMSKSYGNAIEIRESPDTIRQKIKTMITDPARGRRSDPGNPDRCPFWAFHVIYSDTETQDWARSGCKNASIGCLDCKKPVIQMILEEQEVLLERTRPYLKTPSLIEEILQQGGDKAKKAAEKTMLYVREAVGL